MLRRKSLFSIILIGLFLTTGLFYFAGCGSGGGDLLGTILSPTPTNTGIGTKWTVMVYLCADNDLETVDSDDIREMESVGSKNGVNVVVQWDRAGTYNGDQDWKGCRRYYVKESDLLDLTNLASEVVEEMGDVNMGDKQTLIDFVKWGMDNYPADRYAVILWNHGSGWTYANELKSRDLTKAICWDDTSGDKLTQPELKQAFDTIYSETGNKIEVIGMDACLMAMLEVAYSFKDTANYMAFSEDLEPGYGWDYGFLSKVVDNPDMDGAAFTKAVVDEYAAYYAGDSDITMSAVKLSTIDPLVSAINDFSTVAISKIATYRDPIRTCCDSARTFSSGYDDYRDVGNTFDIMTRDIDDAEIKAKAQAVKDALYNFVIAEYHDSSNSGATGVAIWIPDSGMFGSYSEKYSALQFAKDSNWDEFLTELNQ